MSATTSNLSAIGHPGAATAQSHSGVTNHEPRWYSVLSLVLAAFAVAFSFMAWLSQRESDTRWSDAQRHSDAAWSNMERENTARWETMQRETIGRLEAVQREADGRWEKSYKSLERESRLAQLKQDDLRVALLAQGIKTNKHAAGESP